MAVDAHFSSYQIEFDPDEALEFARRAPAVCKITSDRMVALIERINQILPRTLQGRMFHKLRISRTESRFFGVPKTVGDLGLEKGRLLSVVLYENDFPSEYRGKRLSDLGNKLTDMESQFKCSRCVRECGGDGSEQDFTEIKFFWK